MRRLENSNGEIMASLGAYVGRIQANAERQQYASRRGLLRRDKAHDSFLERHTHKV